MLIDQDGLLLAYLISLSVIIFGSIFIGQRMAKKGGAQRSVTKMIAGYLILTIGVLTAFFFAAYPVTYDNYLAVWSMVGSIAVLFGLGFLIYFMQNPDKNLVKAVIQKKHSNNENNRQH
ncbi:hypothetical protein [Evansella halocellulosilytica]|uniref:hypothetical protein n=1 Tax=Evansella halocellulosilytica TaxID=2011013 RepID=UPI000BB92E75|nr:hypothetical protein [Evansella halocellulosilytica]